jgi:hypothetical protein
VCPFSRFNREFLHPIELKINRAELFITFLSPAFDAILVATAAPPPSAAAAAAAALDNLIDSTDWGNYMQAWINEQLTIDQTAQTSFQYEITMIEDRVHALV